MDLYKAIQDLYAEKEKLERVIASLEELQRTAGSFPVLPKPAKRRGRQADEYCRPAFHGRDYYRRLAVLQR